MKTDEAMMALCEAMRTDHGGGVEFELSLGELVGRYRAAHERRMRDQQAAELLPLGREVASRRLNVAPSTVYKMTHRHRARLSTVETAA